MEKVDNLNLEFSAVYDPQTLKILQIGQTKFLDTDVNVVPIDFDLAMKVIEGHIAMTKCFANLDKFLVEIIEQRSLDKIEDILHRIPDIQHSKYDHYDIVLTLKKDKIIIELSSEVGGSYQQSKIKKRIDWKSNINLYFILTDYNDPHIIYHTIKFPLFDLIDRSKIISNIKFPKEFSIYTDRVFKSYAIKNENN